jgi:glycosyltransferase involved in cell wall biosynthesis
MIKMKLIDATHINSFGGKSIFDLIFLELKKRKIEYLYFLLDKRLKIDYIKCFPKKNYSVIDSTHFNRYFFYKKNSQRFDSIICLSNIPPPIKTSVRTIIFFHNYLFLTPFAHKIDSKGKLLNYIKHNYIKFFNQSHYEWVVQTKLMSKLITNGFNINPERSNVFPIFDDCDKSKIENFSKLKCFAFVSSGVSHKNHKNLISAFILAASKSAKKIKLVLTLDKEQIFIRDLPVNLQIEFRGTLDKTEVNKLYNTCEFVIYPSFVESFGLPLIEATNHGCKVIASDLPYVHEIIEPSLTFDPYSTESISNAILNAINTDDLPKTKVLVENKLDNFIEFIISLDVQK